jgi:hypothetical protein
MLTRGEKVVMMQNNLEKDIFQKIRKLPEIQKMGVLSYVEFLNEKFKRLEGHKSANRAIKAVEDTWGTINLSRTKLKYIAEDKDLEYEV